MNELAIYLREAQVFRGSVSLLGPVSWELLPGKNWIVTGDNGSGKSTLLRLLAGEMFPSLGRRVYGLGQAEQFSPLGLRNRLVLLSPENQDLYVQRQWNFPCLQIVLAGQGSPFFYLPPGAEKEKQARELFAFFGMQKLEQRPFLDLSTGEGRKVLLLQALLRAPDIFFLDEFTTGLDRIFLKEIQEMLAVFISQGKQVVFASHRQDNGIDGMTGELHLEKGRIVRKEKMSVPFFRQTPCFWSPSPGQSPLFEICDASVVRGKQVILENISFCQRNGENWAIVGENGAGKSTLLRLVLGRVHSVPGGRVSRHGCFQGPLIDFHRFVGYVASALQAEWPVDCTVREILASGFFFSQGLFQQLEENQREKVEEIACLFELEELLERPSFALSYGQKRRALIARALVHSPALLLLDEPFTGLSAAWREKIRSILQTRCDQGMNLLMVAHRLEDMQDLVSHILVLEQGRIRARGLARDMACLL